MELEPLPGGVEAVKEMAKMDKYVLKKQASYIMLLMLHISSRDGQMSLSEALASSFFIFKFMWLQTEAAQ